MADKSKCHPQFRIAKAAYAANAQAERAHTHSFDIKDKDAGRSMQRLLRRPEVEARTGISRSTLYEWMKRGEFPAPVKLGARIVAWRERDVTDWLESREVREV